jgi:threonine dehydratase
MPKSPRPCATCSADTHNAAEGAGAASFAAAMQERGSLGGQVVGTTLCGGNVDARVFAQVLSGP